MAGWCQDTKYEDKKTGDTLVEPDFGNDGFMERNSWFRRRFKMYAAPLRSSGFTFLSTFKHEFHGVQKPLPPGSKVLFTLTRSRDPFVISRVANHPSWIAPDTENYKINILGAMLYVKVAQMSFPLYQQLKTRHAKQPIRYFFRGLQIRVTNISIYYTLISINPI